MGRFDERVNRLGSVGFRFRWGRHGYRSCVMMVFVGTCLRVSVIVTCGAWSVEVTWQFSVGGRLTRGLGVGQKSSAEHPVDRGGNGCGSGRGWWGGWGWGLGRIPFLL